MRLSQTQYPEGQQESARSAQSGYKAPGIEQVRNVPSRLQVRYYRTDQKELATSVGEALKLPASADNAIIVKSEKVLPDGTLELCLPRSGRHDARGQLWPTRWRRSLLLR